MYPNRKNDGARRGACRSVMLCSALAVQVAMTGVAVAAPDDVRSNGQCPGTVPLLLPSDLAANPVSSVQSALALGSAYPHCETAIEGALGMLDALESVAPDDIDSRRQRDYLRFGWHWRAVLQRNRALEEQIDALKNIEQQMNQREELREFP